MIRHWCWVAVVVSHAGCRESESEPRAVSAAPLDAYAQPTVLVVPIDAAMPRPDAYQPMTSASTPCLEANVEGTITVAPKTVTYCQRERTCAVWNRKTKALRIESKFDVEADPDAVVGTTAAPKPADDSRISFPEDRIELCPPDRACFRFRPDQSNGVEVRSADLSPDSSIAAVLLSGEGGARARVELWSVATGRRKAQIPVRGLIRGEDHDIRFEFVPGGLIVYVLDSDEYASAALYGLDGGLRAELGDGSRFLGYDDVYMLDRRRLAVFDWGEDGAPYRVLVQDVRTGGVLARFKIPLAGEENANVDRFDEAIIVLEQWSTELRVDLVDARPKRGVHEFFIAPGCP